MALPAAFLDELRARTPLAALVGRRVKLSRSGRNWKGCCPFHNERTPSFTVYEDGYHCFGCGAHGDAVSFVMQTGGLAFPDAVAQLAAEAGLEVPQASPQAAQQRLDLTAVLDAAQAIFTRRLHAPEGAAGLAYLHERGLTDDTIRHFGLGWSGDGRGALIRELAAQEIPLERLVEAGLVRDGEGGDGTHRASAMGARELFFGRVTFPIRDHRGQIISFGGRILGDGKPKYLNGPETSLFQKRRTLFGLDLAREGVREGAALLVAEGYLDVIALHQAGFRGAVAPLGTALTDEQLEALWRLSPMPVLCFDGDAAGRRAAARAADIALPLLTPDRSLSLASLPEGEDPDSLVRHGGPAAMRAVLDRKQPLSAALYGLLSEGSPPTPEGRAQLRRRLEEAAKRVGDRALAGEYKRVLLDRFFEERRGGRKPAPSRGTTARIAFGADLARRERARNLVAILLRHPHLLPDVDEAFAAIDLPAPLAALRHAMHEWADTAETLDSETLLSHLRFSGLAAEIAQTLANHPMPLPACAHADAMPAEAAEGWWHLFQLFGGARLADEVHAAGRAFAAQADGAAQDRVVSLRSAQHALLATQQAEDED